MRVTIKDLQDGKEVLTKLLGTEIGDFKIAYRLRRMADKFMSERTHYEKFKLGQVKIYAELDANGRPVLQPTGKGGFIYPIKKEFQDIFEKEMEKLEASEVDFDFDPIPVSMIEECMTKHGVRLSAMDLASLDIFIDHTTEKQPPEEKKK